MAEVNQGQQVGRTKTGLLLLVIGSVLAAAPIVGVIGLLLLLVGAILVILGRRAFGAAHSRNAMLALVVVLVGIVGTIALAAILAASVVASALSSTFNPDAIASALQAFFLGTIVITAIFGLAPVLITWALQKQVGRMLLLAGYAVDIAIAVVTYILLSAAVSDLLARFRAGTASQSDITSFSSQTSGIAYLGFIPNLIFAAAYYMAWARVNGGELPHGLTPGAAPAALNPPR